MKPLKVLFFDFVTHYGGAQQCTVLLCSQLKKTMQLDVLDAYGFCEKYINAYKEFCIEPVVLQSNSRKIFIGNIDKPFRRLVSICAQIPAFIKLRTLLISEIQKLEPDIVWTNSPKGLTFLMSSFKLRKYAVVLYVHTWFRKQEVSWFWRCIIKRADAVLSVSIATANAMQQWGVDKNKIHVVHHAIDFNEIIQKSKEPIKGYLPGNNAEIKIVVPGQLVRTKGHHTAIETAHILKKKGYSFTVLIIGDQKIGDENYASMLLEMICKYKLEANVFMLGWRDDLPAIMSQCNIVLFPTHSEGLGKVIEEAMLIRKPVVSTPSGGITDLIRHGQTGLLAPVDDADAMAEQIEKLINDKILAQTICENAYKYLTELFSLNKHVNLVKIAFERITAKKEQHNGKKTQNCNAHKQC